jgi:mannose-6-phosphate isomerase-like protein (cupin superfamily)
MKTTFSRPWKIWLVGFIFIVLLTPSTALLQGPEPVKFKLFQGDDFIKMVSPTPDKLHRIEILTTDKEGAKALNGIFGIMPSAPAETKPSYHYHNTRESVIMVLQGEGTAWVEGQPVSLEAGDVIFYPPKVKHSIVNTSGRDFRYIEFFTSPPLMSDFVPVK